MGSCTRAIAASVPARAGSGLPLACRRRDSAGPKAKMRVATSRSQGTSAEKVRSAGRTSRRGGDGERGRWGPKGEEGGGEEGEEGNERGEGALGGQDEQERAREAADGAHGRAP